MINSSVNNITLQLDEMIRWGDKDGDGVVGAQEFLTMMMDPMRKQLASQRGSTD